MVLSTLEPMSTLGPEVTPNHVIKNLDNQNKLQDWGEYAQEHDER